MKKRTKNNVTLNDDNITNDMINRAIKISCSDEFIDKLEDGVNHNIGENGSKLSGGQKQRLSIARALVNNPIILFLDESTNSLSFKIKERLINNLVEETKNGLTIIINSHETILKQFADNVVQLDQKSDKY